MDGERETKKPQMADKAYATLAKPIWKRMYVNQAENTKTRRCQIQRRSPVSKEKIPDGFRLYLPNANHTAHGNLDRESE